MKNIFYTDLAAEALNAWEQGQNRALSGLAAGREEREGFAADVAEIRDRETSEALCKPIGRYVTLDLGALIRREEDAFPRACRALAGELRRQLSLRAA